MRRLDSAVHAVLDLCGNTAGSCNTKGSGNGARGSAGIDDATRFLDPATPETAAGVLAVSQAPNYRLSRCSTRIVSFRASSRTVGF